ncbi:MAG: shikimate kinase [Alphaproteobacteria bacterium]|jgi:shikimate kinase
MNSAPDDGKVATSAEYTDTAARQACENLGTRPIVLIGLMGAGKTSIGRRLATRLAIPFIDADQEIEKAAGKTISDIFSDHGEDSFRDGERRVIARLLSEGLKVLATGGGAFMNEETRQRILEKGVSVWLNADLDILMERVSRRDNRPLLKTDNPRAVMEKLLAERYPVYAQANIAIESRDVPHEVIVDEIVNALATYSGS